MSADARHPARRPERAADLIASRIPPGHVERECGEDWLLGHLGSYVDCALDRVMKASTLLYGQMQLVNATTLFDWMITVPQALRNMKPEHQY